MRKIVILMIAVALIISICSAMAEETLSGTLFDQIASEQPETAAVTSSGDSGVLRSDNMITSMRNGTFCVLGSDIDRASISAIRFINNTDDVARDFWDVSAAQDESVLAWIVDETLYIGAEGGVKAPADCTYMFALYRNLRTIDFSTNFDTSSTTDMTGMFASCESLLEIDLNALDVSGVTSMESMFEGCDHLKAIHASDWVLSSLRNSTNIFNGCKKLGFDTIDGIWTEKYEELKAIAAKTWPPLKIDSRGNSVAKLQQRLMDLGYNSITKADGIYGTRTSLAVHAFKDDHNIYDGTTHSKEKCIASGLMQEALYAEDATPAGQKSEKTTAVNSAAVSDNVLPIISEDSNISSKNLSGNQLKLNFDITNRSTERTIVSYSVSVYTTSVWGNDLYEAPLSFTFDASIDPSATAKTGDIIVDDRGQIANLYIGIESVTYDDGTTVTADKITYSHFTAVQWV